MKLIVIIPAYNEEKTIAKVISSIPRKIKGINKVEILVINDGSTDETVKEARKVKVDNVFSHKTNQGLTQSFNDGIQAALKFKADIIVSTDADNQYDQKEIPKLLHPILLGKADMVIGNRQIENINFLPISKKYGNIFGSWIIRMITGCDVKDVSSGFRAYTHKCVQKFNLLSNHTYTHETIIQVINKNLVIVEVPITFRKRKYGNSRLISSVWEHIKKSSVTIIRTILMYKAFKVLVNLGFLLMFFGLVGCLRFLYFYLNGNSSGHIQSLILSSIFISIGFTTMVMGVLADLISINRQLIEERK